MPVFDVSGSLKVIGDKAGNLEVRDPSGAVTTTTASFIQFSGSAVTGVATSSTGVVVTIVSGSGGGGGGVSYYEVAKRMNALG